jgi:hypothetical protein
VPHVRLVGKLTVVVEGGDPQKRRLMRRFGINSKQLDALLARLAQATVREGHVNEGELNLMVGLIWDHKPETQMELHVLSLAAIATVMAARGAHRVADSDTLPQQDSGERLWSKSSRTYAMLVEQFYRARLQRRHLAQLDEPPEGRAELLAITDQRTVPMPLVQPADAAAVSNPAQQERSE